MSIDMALVQDVSVEIVFPVGVLGEYMTDTSAAVADFTARVTTDEHVLAIDTFDYETGATTVEVFFSAATYLASRDMLESMSRHGVTGEIQFVGPDQDSWDVIGSITLNGDGSVTTV